MRERFVEKSSHLILAEARLNAPIRSGELRDSGEIRRTTRSAQTTTDTITFSRVAPGPGYIFDVAKWTHDPEEFPRDGYTPSSPDPRVGPKYLLRAYEAHSAELNVEFVESVRFAVK